MLFFWYFLMLSTDYYCLKVNLNFYDPELDTALSVVYRTAGRFLS